MTRILLNRLSVLCLFLLSTTFWTACNKDLEQTSPTQSLATDQFEARLVRDWMDIAYNTVKRQGMFALDASRTYAYVAIAMHESMVHGIPNGRSLAGQLQGLNTLPQPEAGKIYDWGIVLCHTLPQIMDEMVPTMSVESDYMVDALERQQEVRLRESHTISDEVMDDSKAFADQLANALIAWSRTDNRLGMENLVYTPPSRIGNPQYYEPTTPGAVNFMMPFWWTSRPFVIPSYAVCSVPPPYTYSEDPNSAYYKDVKEVLDASQDPDKVAIGRYWANNPGLSGSPAGSWLNIGGQLVEQFNLDIVTTLRMYVLMAIGTRDGFIACWHQKYKYNLQRPATYIREVLGQPNWQSPVPTPPYPDYTSGTSVNAGCSSEILTQLFGLREFVDNQHQDKGFGVRKFEHFKKAGVEAYHSRIYGGVHMRRACELGFEQGECLAKQIIERLDFTR